MRHTTWKGLLIFCGIGVLLTIPSMVSREIALAKKGYWLDIAPATANSRFGSGHWSLQFYDGRKLLWKKEIARQVLAERATPEGRLWIITGADRQSSSGSRQVMLIERDGRTIAFFGFGDTDVHGENKGPTYDWHNAKAIQPRSNDSVDVLRVDESSGANMKLIVMRPGDFETYIFRPLPAATADDWSLRDAIFDAGQPLPHHASDLFGGWSVFTSGENAWILQTLRTGTGNHGEPLMIDSIKKIEGDPDNTARTPSGMPVHFFYGKGLMVIYDSKYDEIYREDLFALTGARNAEELKERLPVNTLRESDGHGWYDPVDKPYYGGSSSLEKLEMVASDGRHFVWSIHGQARVKPEVSVETLTGLYARHGTEIDPPGVAPKSEVIATSPNGRLTLRVREYEYKTHFIPVGPKWFITLISNERGDHGDTVPVQLWTEFSYSEVLSPVVSDSGLAVWFVVSHYENTANPDNSSDTEACFIRPPNKPTQQIGLRKWADGREMDYGSVTEARRDLLLSHTKIRSLGHLSDATVSGLTFPQYNMEMFSVYRKSGPPVEFTVTAHGVTRDVLP